MFSGDLRFGSSAQKNVENLKSLVELPWNNCRRFDSLRFMEVFTRCRTALSNGLGDVSFGDLTAIVDILCMTSAVLPRLGHNLVRYAYAGGQGLCRANVRSPMPRTTPEAS
jgi:hypothetical protein